MSKQKVMADLGVLFAVAAVNCVICGLILFTNNGVYEKWACPVIMRLRS